MIRKQSHVNKLDFIQMKIKILQKRQILKSSFFHGIQIGIIPHVNVKDVLGPTALKPGFLQDGQIVTEPMEELEGVEIRPINFFDAFVGESAINLRE